MFRDRTNLYISYRQSYAHHPSKRPKPRFIGPRDDFHDTPSLSEERRGLIAGAAAPYEDDGDAVIEMDILPPRWVDAQEEVTELLAEIAHQSAQLTKLHQKHVLPGFGDEEVRRRDEVEIERLTQEITRGFRECQRAIGRIERMVREAKMVPGGAGVSKGEETMARNIQISLAARVQEASTKFRKSQSSYLKKLRGLDGLPSPAFEPRSSTPAQNPYADPSLMDSEVDKSYSQSTLSQLQTSQQRQYANNDTTIAQREREINDIAKGIIELSDIFKDLQTMIIDQGTMLDRIDFNVERMTTEVKGAERELKVATNYQKRTAKRKIMLLLFLIVVGLFILLLIKPKKHHDPSPKMIRIRGYNIPEETTHAIQSRSTTTTTTTKTKTKTLGWDMRLGSENEDDAPDILLPVNDRRTRHRRSRRAGSGSGLNVNVPQRERERDAGNAFNT